MNAQDRKTVLITGGAGFVGANLAQRLLQEPHTVVRVFDNVSRAGVRRNLNWLQDMARPSQLEIILGDVRDRAAVRQATRGVSEIFHLAAQVAVTNSIADPMDDFSINALGTLNVLEAARSLSVRPFVLFTSTNKVYGSLHGVPVEVNRTRYQAANSSFTGVTEEEALDFHSPYGCSKGAADQYTRDYARIYDIDSVVFRMSCIAGPRQFGNEDQGWVAHFLYSVLEGRTITVCGDGFQVRDILHVHDLIDAMLAARTQRTRTRGEVYNIGGGLQRTTSVIELLHECERRLNLPLHLKYTSVRPGDQPLYISDTKKLEEHTGWKPKHSLENILEDIDAFWHKEIAANVGAAAAIPSETSRVTEEVA